ncbi:MAG TPA: hypothetical protein PLQ11_07720 [Beijerinckiaceae bacterium]|nr:hypothetical protein [Beijerinckiaceae bacterium]
MSRSMKRRGSRYACGKAPVAELCSRLAITAVEMPSLAPLMELAESTIRAQVQRAELMQAELERLRNAVTQQHGGHSRTPAFMHGVRHAEKRMQTWLHERAEWMNDPNATSVLHSAAFDLGGLKWGWIKQLHRMNKARDKMNKLRASSCD